MAHGIEIPSTADRPDQRAGATTTPRCRRLVSLQQAADHAGVPIEVICGLIRAGKLKAYRLDGGLQFDEVELARFLLP